MKKIYLILLLFIISCITDTYIVIDCNNPNYDFLMKKKYTKDEINNICKKQTKNSNIGVPLKK